MMLSRVSDESCFGHLLCRVLNSSFYFKISTFIFYFILFPNSKILLTVTRLVKNARIKVGECNLKKKHADGLKKLQEREKK